MNPQTVDWTKHLIFTRNLTLAGERSAHFDAAKRGEFVQVARGAYIATTLWNDVADESRHRARIEVARSSVGRLLLSHFSAAVLWRLPFIRPLPEEVHVTVELADGGRSNKSVRRHALGIPASCVQIDGLSVTTLARTVIDMACVLDFGAAVCMADAALHRTMRPIPRVPRSFLQSLDLHAELDRIPTRHGSAKAAAVVNFANGLADRPGESMSRVSMYRAGITPPQLQVSLLGASGKTYTVDFFWPEFGVIGEFDGRAKYTDPEFLNGRTPEQALFDEKAREDDLRAAGYGLTRWMWETAISPNLLKAHLARAGVR